MLKTEAYPKWVQEIREIFRAGTISQYLLYGNVHDFVPWQGENGTEFHSLRHYLANMLFGKFDVVLYYSRGAGVTVLRDPKGCYAEFLKIVDTFANTNYSTTAPPRDALQAMDLLGRFLEYSMRKTRIEGGQTVGAPLRVAVLIDYVQFLAPEAGGQVNERSSETLIRLLDWASNPDLLNRGIVTVLISENLVGVSRALVENPHSSKLRIPLPTEEDCLEFLEYLKGKFPELESSVEVSLDVVAKKVVGLTRVSLQHMVALAVKNGQKLTSEYLSKTKKELIEKECAGLLEFVESKTTLDHVAGHEGVKKWLREDAQLLREGKFNAVPMGYLMTGRIGTGKTWVTHCWAGEVGIPFVVFKNFRDKWMGATESNLEKIFTVLKALGQVVVFVDEADQMAGKRGGGDSDSGVSGRIYGMLAAEMSNTHNRGRVIWVFATSRPDLLEVDLKRPGRLDVHIPLFPPQNDEERMALFQSMARKVKLPMKMEELPQLPSGMTDLGGNEMEALMVRAVRIYELQKEGEKKPLKEILAQVIEDYRPSPHTKNLEYMDLVAVKECTDDVFLPLKYQMPPAEVDRRIDLLKAELNIP